MGLNEIVKKFIEFCDLIKDRENSKIPYFLIWVKYKRNYFSGNKDSFYEIDSEPNSKNANRHSTSGEQIIGSTIQYFSLHSLEDNGSDQDKIDQLDKLRMAVQAIRIEVKWLPNELNKELNNLESEIEKAFVKCADKQFGKHLSSNDYYGASSNSGIGIHCSNKNPRYTFFNNFITFSNVFNEIPETLNSGLKLYHYINTVFILELKTYLIEICLYNAIQANKRSFEDFIKAFVIPLIEEDSALQTWFNDLFQAQISSYIGPWDNHVKKESKKSKVVLLGKHNKLEREFKTQDIENFCYFLQSRDIQFWKKLILGIKNNKDIHWKKDLFGSSREVGEIISTINELNNYRNIAFHMGLDCIDNSWVIRTLTILIKFADKLNEPSFKAELQKRKIYEIYASRLDFEKSYYEINYKNYSFSDSNTAIPCWKSCVSINKDVNADKLPNTHDCRGIFPMIVSMFITTKDVEQIEKIKAYYYSHSVLFPNFVSTPEYWEDYEQTYPFHPEFVAATIGLSSIDLFYLIKSILERDYNDTSYSKCLIMPSEIDIDFTPIKKNMIGVYSSGVGNKSISDLGWLVFSHEILSKENNKIKKLAQNIGVGIEEINEINKTITLISQSQPDLEFVRFCVLLPGNSIVSLEKILFSLPEILYLYLDAEKRKYCFTSSGCFMPYVRQRIGIVDPKIIEDLKKKYDYLKDFQNIDYSELNFIDMFHAFRISDFFQRM